MGKDDLAAYSKWVAVQSAPWSAPATLEPALRKMEKEPAIWLNQTVDMMAFGDNAVATDPMEGAARRCQASRALCEAARRGNVRLIGCPDRPGDLSDPIPRPYFDVPRQLGDQDNSLSTNLDALSDNEFTVAHAGGHQKWFSVRAETGSLMEWLRGFVPARELELPIEGYMIEPMTKAGKEGYVPLSSALLWVMTDSGTARMSLHDDVAWDLAADRLLPLISSGQIEVVGRPVVGGTSEVIIGSTFAGILIGRPLSGVTKMLLGDNPWIMSTPYLDAESWRECLNDQLFARRAQPASWTHLQVKKADILRCIAFGALNPSSIAHFNKGGRPEEYNWDEIRIFALDLINKFGLPSKGNKRLPTKQALIEAICEEWSSKRDIILSEPTVRRHLSDWLKPLNHT